MGRKKVTNTLFSDTRVCTLFMALFVLMGLYEPMARYPREKMDQHWRVIVSHATEEVE
jgi:hypothetical protein